MKRIKDFCIEILNKVKEHFVTTIAIAIFSSIVAIGLFFKKHLTTVYTFTLPFWTWILLCVVISCSPVLILRIIDFRRKRKVLTDEDDVFNKLHWWVGQQQDFVRRETENNKLVTWHFSGIDRSLGLVPGSAKKFLPAMFSAKPKVFNISVVNEGQETIALRYDIMKIV